MLLGQAISLQTQTFFFGFVVFYLRLEKDYLPKVFHISTEQILSFCKSALNSKIQFPKSSLNPLQILPNYGLCLQPYGSLFCLGICKHISGSTQSLLHFEVKEMCFEDKSTEALDIRGVKQEMEGSFTSQLFSFWWGMDSPSPMRVTQRCETSQIHLHFSCCICVALWKEMHNIKTKRKQLKRQHNSSQQGQEC